MNKQGKIIIGILVIMVVLVLTSALILSLVKAGVIKIKSSGEEVNILNTEFLPFGREGYLAIKGFQFCEDVDENYICSYPTNEFLLGDKVYFRFVVESSTYNNEIMIVENYQIKGPDGSILLEVDESDNFYFNSVSTEKNELITFKDYFTVTRDSEVGTYTLELMLENPLLDKKTKLVKEFEIVSFMFVSRN